MLGLNLKGSVQWPVAEKFCSRAWQATSMSADELPEEGGLGSEAAAGASEGIAEGPADELAARGR